MLGKLGGLSKLGRPRVFVVEPICVALEVMLSLQTRYASESMSDQDDWEFAGPDDAKAEIRAAVEYLLRGATGGARGDIVQEIIAIARQVAGGLPPEPPNSLDG